MVAFSSALCGLASAAVASPAAAAAAGGGSAPPPRSGLRGRGGFAVAGDVFGPLPAGEKRLNYRAVATMMEINVREAGRRYLGASWLIRRWRKLAQSDP